MEYTMLTERHAEEAKRIRRESRKAGRDYSPRRGKKLVPRTDGLVQALQTSLTMDHYLLVIPKSINMQSVFLNDTSKELKIMATSQKSTLKSYPTLTASSVASLAKRLALRASEKDSKIQEARSFLTSHGYSGKNSHAIVSLRTSKGFYLTTAGELLPLSSPRLMSWGTMHSGRCLTAKISESPRIGSACSLSDTCVVLNDLMFFH